MPFVKILEAFGPYREGEVHEVNENRRDRFLDSGKVELCEGPATVLPGSAEDQAKSRVGNPQRRADRKEAKAGAVKSSATASKASPPGRKVKQ